MSTLRDAILACNDIQEEIMTIPQWNNTKVLVRGLSGTARDDFERRMIPDDKALDKTLYLENTRAKLVCMCCFDPETKELVFSLADAVHVGKKSGKVLNDIYKKAKDLSGMVDDIEDAAKK